MQTTLRLPSIARPRASVAWLIRSSAHPLVRDVLVPLAATRLALIGVALVTFRLPLDPAADLSSNHLLSALARWDGGWYVHIAAEGYGYTDGEFQAVAFSPLLPVLMRALAPVFGGDMNGLLIAGVVIANLALVAACVLALKLARLDLDEATARRVPLYLLAFPTSFFLSAIYPESLFLALAIGAFYCARREHWILAGALAALCVLARPYGILVAPALALEYLHQRGFALSRVRADALALLLPVASLGGWLAFQYAQFGDALAFLHAQSAWQRVPGPPWQAITSYFTPGAQHGPWNDLMFVMLFVFLAVVAVFTLRPSYAVFAFLLVLAPLSTGQAYSMMRFGLSIFPAFLALAWLGRSALFDRAYVPAGLVIGGAFMTFFVTQLFFLA